MIEFARRAGAARTLEDKNILAMMMQRRSGEITLELSDEQYAKLRKARRERSSSRSDFKPIGFGDKTRPWHGGGPPERDG